MPDARALVARDVWAQPPGAEEPVLRGVSLEVGRGEWLAVTGPNGGGKTTLALAMAGLWAVSRGSVEVSGVPLVATAAGRVAAGIATVLQEPASQLFERTVRDEIGFALRNLGASDPAVEASVAEWSDRLGLESWLDRDPHELSAGWQQLVLLAGALASRPRLLVVDEGAAHLDPAARSRTLAAVRDRVSEGLAVLWVTQEPAESRAADRMVAVDSGTLDAAASGSPADSPEALGVEIGSSSPPWPHQAGSPAIRVRIEPRAPLAGRRVAVDRVLEFTAAPGRPVALVGPNGAGKSLVIEAIAGVSPCDQVQVDFHPGPRRSPILAAQHPELQVFGDSVREELVFAARERGADPDRALGVATQLLTELGLGSGFLSRSAWSLSAGQRRLLQVVASLVTPADAILLDEPTCGLDARRAARLGRILGRLAQWVALVVATQDAGLPTELGAAQVRLGE